MSPSSLAFLLALIASIVIAVLVDRLLRPGLRGLLEEIVALPDATDFYLRAFVIVLVFAALAAVLNGHVDLKAGAPFMEYVWAIAARLRDVVQNLFAILLVYVGLMTILLAALRRKQ